MDAKFSWVYTDKAKDHFINPRNVLEDEKSFADDGKGVVGNIKCGDQMLMAIIRHGYVPPFRGAGLIR